MKQKMFKIFIWTVGIIVGVAAIAALSYYWFARFEIQHTIAVVLAGVLILVAIADSDTAPFFVALAIICFALALFLPKTGDTRTECRSGAPMKNNLKKNIVAQNI